MADIPDKDDRGEPVPVKVIDRRWWARDAQGEAPTEEPWEPRKPTYVEELERQLADKDALLQSYQEQYKQATAEFDTVKTRLRRDVAKEVERARRLVLVELLDVLDNLDRAVAAAHTTEDAAALVAGVELVERQFIAKLATFGVTRIESLGEPFDPARHDAVATVLPSDEFPEGTVAGVVKPGYMIGDEVLRPAMVAVANSPSNASS